MKIRQFMLRRYGHFTDHLLDFNLKPNCNFHIICDHNEAGKTTSQNGLKDLLFGIPERSHYAFLHGEDTSLSGILEDSRGQVKHFLRLKSRQQDLLDGITNQVLSPNDLLPFIGPLNKDLLSTLFALSYQTLREGSAEIAKMNELGKILFATSSSIPGMNRLIEHIQKEEELLYKKNGRKPKLNEALQKYSDIDKSLKHYRQSGVGEKNDKEIKKNQECYAKIEIEIESLRRDLERLKRYRDTKPLLCDLNKLESELEKLGTLPRLRNDISTYWIGLQKDLKHQDQTVDALQLALEKVELELLENTLTEPEQLLLLYQTEISQLARESDLIYAYQKDLESIAYKSKQVQDQINRCLQELNLSDQSQDNMSFMPTDSFLLDTLELCEEGKTLKNTLQTHIAALNDAESKVQILGAELSHLLPPGDLTPLRLTLEACAEDGNLDQLYHLKKDELDECRLEFQQLHTAHRFCLSSLDILFNTHWPSVELMHDYEVKFKTCEDEIRNNTKLLRGIEAKLSELAVEFKIGRNQCPSHDDLHQARRQRDADWSLIREHLTAGKPHELQVAINSCEKKLSIADEISDKRFAHAHEAARIEALEGQIELEENKKKHQKNELEQLQAHQQSLENKWKQLWIKLTDEPLSPREMKDWLKQTEVLQCIHLEIGKKELALSKLNDQMDRHCVALRNALESLGKPMGAAYSNDYRILRSEAKKTFESLQALQSDAESKRQQLQWEKKQRDSWQEKVSQENEIFQQWTSRWQESLKRLSQPVDTGSEGGKEIIQTYQMLKELYRKKYDQQQEFEKKEFEITTFQQRIKDVMASLVPEEINPSGTLKSIKKELDLVLKKAQGRKNSEQEQMKLQRQLSEAQQQQALLQAQKNCFFQQAGVTFDEEMYALISSLERQVDLQNKHGATLRALEGINGGSFHSALKMEINAMEIDEINMQIECREEKKKTAVKQKEEFSNQITRHQLLLQQNDDSDELFKLNAQRESHKAEIAKWADEALLRRAAACLLQKAVECHRLRSQREQVRRAANLFQRLTCHQYINLIVEEEKGKEVLKAQKKSGALVSPREMSDGTCDQLYLALRLAALEEYAQRAEPIPFIADDLLVNFDNQRSMAALKVLGEFSKTIQVIFFTHHAHLLEIAEQCLGEENFSVQKLSLSKETYA